MNKIKHVSLVRQVNGCLSLAIHHHGPITNQNSSSATKRIVGQIWAYLKEICPECMEEIKDSYAQGRGGDTTKAIKILNDYENQF